MACRLFGRVLRTLGGKNIGKCRLRAHQHPLSPPLSIQRRCKDFPFFALLRASILDFRPRLENRCKLFQVYTIFRASILDFKPRLENRCKLFSGNNLLPASILDFRPKLENRCKVSHAEFVLLTMSASDSNLCCAEKNGPPAAVVAATTSEADSNLRCSKEEWPACSMVVGRRQGLDATKAA